VEGAFFFVRSGGSAAGTNETFTFALPQPALSAVEGAKNRLRGATA
jgi:hypothetical protein